jgi:hypothetical protein
MTYLQYGIRRFWWKPWILVRYIRNIKSLGGYPEKLYKNCYKNFFTALQSAFTWSASPEGHAYWSKLDND